MKSTKDITGQFHEILHRPSYGIQEGFKNNVKGVEGRTMMLYLKLWGGK